MSFYTYLQTLLIGLAGGAGAVARYLIGRFMLKRMGAHFPFGTLLINVTGAFCIGLLFALAGRGLLSPQVQAILATGFLGGYTTFSTMSWEGFQLIDVGASGRSILYLGSSVVLGIVAVLSGLGLGWVL